MKLYGLLVLLVTLSAACGLKCYTCLLVSDASTCTNIQSCPTGLDRCASLVVSGLTTKGCENRLTCISPIDCCEGDLCNSAITTGSSVLLLLLSSAIITIFL